LHGRIGGGLARADRAALVLPALRLLLLRVDRPLGGRGGAASGRIGGVGCAKRGERPALGPRGGAALGERVGCGGQRVRVPGGGPAGGPPATALEGGRPAEGREVGVPSSPPGSSAWRLEEAPRSLSVVLDGELCLLSRRAFEPALRAIERRQPLMLLDLRGI